MGNLELLTRANVHIVQSEFMSVIYLLGHENAHFQDFTLSAPILSYKYTNNYSQSFYFHFFLNENKF